MLKLELGRLGEDKLALSDQERNLHTLLQRVAKEGEEDLECERRRYVK